MIRDKIIENEKIELADNELNILKKYFPGCFNVDGSFDIVKLQNQIQDKVEITKEGFELNFLGKSYAKLLSSIDTTTVIKPDLEHNNGTENLNSENIYISGDNLDALKHLIKSYAGQIKCIYIDPPYNTGSDGFVYKDSFNFTSQELQQKLSITEDEADRILNLTSKGSASHSAWLTFMYPRLKIARDILADDGVILISIDKNEHANLKLLCDDIFGEENYIDSIIWEKKTGAKGVPPKNMMVNVHEYVVAFQKTSSFKFNGIPRDIKSFKNPDNDPRGPWRESNIKSTTKSPDEAFTITDPETGKTYNNTWAFSKSTLEKMINEGRILWKNNLPKQKEYLYEMTNENMALKSSWGVFDPQSTTVYLKKIMPEVHFDNPKPLSFMKYLIKASSGNNDIILDFFSGSATTAHAVMEINFEDEKSNRKYISVQIEEKVNDPLLQNNLVYNTIDKIGFQRIVKTAENLNKSFPNKKVDYGFKHFTLVEPNKNTLDKMFRFDENQFLTDENILKDFGKETVLTTWLNDDGYGLTSGAEEIDLNGYKAYYKGNHLYLIDAGFTNNNIVALFEKYNNDKEFNPENIILFGYSFMVWNVLETLKTNIKQLKSINKNVNVDVRY